MIKKFLMKIKVKHIAFTIIIGSILIFQGIMIYKYTFNGIFVDPGDKSIEYSVLRFLTAFLFFIEISLVSGILIGYALYLISTHADDHVFYRKKH